MKIHIVENEPACIAQLHTLLERWSQERKVSIQIQSYSAGDAFLDNAKEDADLIFLDIQMEGIDGMTVAHRLRSRGYTGQIVFLTSFSEYVFDGYDVQALNYYLKPIHYEKVSWCMDFVQRKISDDHYIYRERTGIIKIPYSHIICFTSANHCTDILTIEGSYRQAEKLSSILARLPDLFRPCHRSIIVNVEHILRLKGSELTLSNQVTVPVSKPYLEEIKTALFSYANAMR